LKFNNGLTSAGVAATDKLANHLGLHAGSKGWLSLLKELPSLAEIFVQASPVIPFVYQPQIAFRSRVVAGHRWVMLPSAVGVVDPLLSTGFPLTLLGIQRLSRILAQEGNSSLDNQLEDYARLTLLELETTARLVGALYGAMDRFEIFTDLSLLYFVAASFSETARRLGKAELANSFLLCRHPSFGAQLLALCEWARKTLCSTESAEFRETVRRAIERFDVAGLTERGRHPWYPAVASDLRQSAAKLDASAAEIEAMLKRYGLQTN